MSSELSWHTLLFGKFLQRCVAREAAIGQPGSSVQ